MIQQIRNNINKHQLLPFEERVIVGLSGGMDSMVLLHLLKKLGYECIASHCNFKLRGYESDEDEAFVRKFCLENQIEAEFVQFDTIHIAKARKISIEMAARDLRYEWFEQIRAKHQAQAIAIAHHANDQAETLLLNLSRGTGVNGLTGMKYKNGRIIRPLLNIQKTSIEDYCRLHHIPYITDSSNKENVYYRNKIRNKIIPVFEELNPSFISTVVETSRRLSYFQQFAAIKIKEIGNRIVSTKGDITIIRLDDDEVKNHIHTILFELLQSFGFINEQIDKIVDSLENESGRMFYSQSHQLNTDREKLILSKLVDKKRNEGFKIEKTGYHFEPIHLSIVEKEKQAEFQISKEKNKIQVDAQTISFPLMLRKWRKGDQFMPFGMQKFKKLSDFFIDEKISRTEKENTWILTDSNDRIIWIVGLRLDNRFRIDRNTENILEISI